MTIVYLIRHSEGFGKLQGIMNTSDSVQIINEKNPLSVNGEHLAEQVSSKEEFNNLDIVWSSNYVRALSTAKYFAVKNNLLVNIDERLRERIQGIKSWDELPKDFEQRQFEDETYTIGFGENQIEVRKRMEEVFFEILNANIGKRVAIVSHATALAFLLKKWCTVEYGKPYVFNNKEFFDGNWHFCETFKLTFDDNNNIIDIEGIIISSRDYNDTSKILDIFTREYGIIGVLDV